MTESAEAPSRAFSERTAWARSLETPLRRFLRTEIGSAAVLLAATLVALAWVNIDSGSYERLWHTQLSIRVGGSSVALDLRHWVNSGLMTLFFFVIGLEARREFDMGELRQRRRIALPVLAGLGGMALPVGIFLAANAGHPSAHGWGVAMSTDTAFALGMLALAPTAWLVVPSVKPMLNANSALNDSLLLASVHRINAFGVSPSPCAMI